MKRKPTDYLRPFTMTASPTTWCAAVPDSVVGDQCVVMFGTDWPHQVHDVKGAFANTAMPAGAADEGGPRQQRAAVFGLSPNYLFKGHGCIFQD